MKNKEKVISSTGAAVGTFIAVGGKSAAMTVATTFGTASTGTAISSLTGVAATNAATAWIGGGAIAAGGGGMAAGTVVLTAIPFVGGAIALGAIGYGAYRFIKSRPK